MSPSLSGPVSSPPTASSLPSSSSPPWGCDDNNAAPIVAGRWGTPRTGGTLRFHVMRISFYSGVRMTLTSPVLCSETWTLRVSDFCRATWLRQGRGDSPACFSPTGPRACLAPLTFCDSSRTPRPATLCCHWRGFPLRPTFALVLFCEVKAHLCEAGGAATDAEALFGLAWHPDVSQPLLLLYFFPPRPRSEITQL